MRWLWLVLFLGLFCLERKIDYDGFTAINRDFFFAIAQGFMPCMEGVFAWGEIFD